MNGRKTYESQMFDGTALDIESTELYDRVSRY